MIVHKIEAGDTAPIKKAPYKTPFSLREEMNRQVQKMLYKGVISPSNSPWGFIKKQRLNWLGHVERMAEDNNVQKIKRWKPMSKRPIGRPKTRWENDILEDIRNMNVRNWKKIAQNRDSWKKAIEQARTLDRL